MSNNGIHLVAVRNGALQLFVLPHNNALGGNQLNLVHHTHHQLFLIKRFCQEVVGTNLETLHQITGIIECRQENDGNICRLWILLQDDCRIKTADVRHHHVEQYQIGLLRLCLLNTRITAVGSTNLKLLVGEENLQQKHIADHIVND